MERDISVLELFKELKLNCAPLSSQEGVESLTLEVWAKPGAKVEKVAIAETGQLIVSTNAPPEDGKANEGIRKVMAKKFGVSKSCIELISGHQSKFKKMAITFVFDHNKDVEYYLGKIKKALG